MKLNKKGFTLVELLAVIAILAVIIAIAVPNVLNIFGDSRTRAIKVDAQAIYEAAITDYQQAQFDSAGAKVYTSLSTGTHLNASTDAEYCIVVDANGVVTKFQYVKSGYKYDSVSANDTDVKKSDVDPEVGTLTISTCSAS